MKHTFIGYKTFTIKQKFVIEADTFEQAKSILQEQERNYGLDSHWLDHKTNKITSAETPDFYDEKDKIVEAAQ